MSEFKCTFRVGKALIFFSQSIGNPKWISLEGRGSFVVRCCCLRLDFSAFGISISESLSSSRFVPTAAAASLHLPLERNRKALRCLASDSECDEADADGLYLWVSLRTNTDFPYLWTEFWVAVPAR